MRMTSTQVIAELMGVEAKVESKIADLAAKIAAGEEKSTKLRGLLAILENPESTGAEKSAATKTALEYMRDNPEE